MTEAEFFDAVYARAGSNESAVPWQQAISRRFIGDWLDEFTPGPYRNAIVVAAGLGDDAAALARRQLEVTAFDFSPTAMEWAASRHAELDIDWQVADLFDLPAEWTAAFDLVVEVFTIQSIEPARQADAAQAIKRLLRTGGRLVAVMLVHDGYRQVEGPPWALHPATLAELAEGLQETARRTEAVNDGIDCVLIDLDRPLHRIRDDEGSS